MKGSSLRIAWRNLWRNSRRTGLALAAIGLSVTLVLAYTSIMRAYSDWIVETLTGPTFGHVQAHAPKWRTDRAMDRTLRNVDTILAGIRRDPDVTQAAARIYAPALAAREQEGFAVMVVGIDVAAESGPARLLSEKVDLRGPEAIVGRQLAEQMGLHAGDKVAVVGQGVDGSLANELLTVKTVTMTAVDAINRQGIVISLDEAQSLFAMPGEAHEIIVHSRRPDDVAALAKRLSMLPSLARQEVLDWQTLAPEMVSIVKLVDLAGALVLILVFLAAAAGVANTMLMATFERTREFGMLLALGARPSRIVRLVLAESVVLGLTGALLGVTVGLALVAVTHRTGIDYSALTGGGPNELSFAGLRWSLRFYPTLASSDVLRAIGAVLVTSLLASLWPAARASRLQPVRALRGT